MMDSAADDLMIASIGRSPRNDPAGGPDPPGSDQADFHGLPLDHATKPASTEAQLRQYKDINLLLTFDSSPFDRSETRPIALHTATLPDMNPDQTSGSAAAEPSRGAPPDAFPRDPADIPDTPRDSAAPASLQPPAEASVDLRHAHAQGSCRAPPGHASCYAAMPGAAPSSDPQPSTAPPVSSVGDVCAILGSATRSTRAEASVDLRHSHAQGSCRAPPGYASGYAAMPGTAPSSDPQPATALPNSAQAALRSLPESATLSHPSQTSPRAEISVEAKPLSVSFSDSGSDGSAYAEAPSRATADTRPSLLFPAVTPAARSLPASIWAADRTLVPNRRPPDTPTVAKLMHELEVVRGERDQSKRERDQLEEEIQIVEVERDEAQFELGTAQQEYKSLLAQNVRLQAENEHLENLTTQLESRLALTSTDPVALALTSTYSVALALTSTDSVAPRPAAGRPGRPNAEVDHPGRPRSDSKPAPGAAPTPAAHAKPALDDSSDASSDSEPESDLPNVDRKYMSSSVQDREHVTAVVESTTIDPAGMTPFRRYLYTAANVEMRKVNLKPEMYKVQMFAGKAVFDHLEIPYGLYSEDTHECSVAYKDKFRCEFSYALSKALQRGAIWFDVLRNMYHRFADPDEGHERLEEVAKVAMRDSHLHDEPLLHAEALLFKLDHSFYSGVEGISRYELITTREPTMDAPTLLATITEAYLEKLDNPKLNRENLLEDKGRRSELFQKARRCLLNDERDPARGKAVSAEFNKLWGAAERKCGERPTKLALADLDLQTFAERELTEVEACLERERADLKNLAPDPNSSSEADSDCASDDGASHYPPPPRNRRMAASIDGASHYPPPPGHRPAGKGASKRRDERRKQERQHFHAMPYNTVPHRYGHY